MATTIQTTLADLWTAYAKPGQETGRVECPIVTAHNGSATHLYSGYGCYRLERIDGQPNKRKGFQGTCVYQTVYAERRDYERYIKILD